MPFLQVIPYSIHNTKSSSSRHASHASLPSLFVSTTEFGDRHDHDKCPLRFGRLTKVDHVATPIHPVASGRKVNIGGEGETAYLGFDDFVTPDHFNGRRPWTSTLRDRCASDICIRSAPITDPVGKREIARIAGRGCRLTVASTHPTMSAQISFLLSLGRVIEYVCLPDQTQ